MRYLLDSHILIWTLFSDDRLPTKARNIINDPDNEIFYSAASVWEIAIKHSKSPDKMPVTGNDLMNYSDAAGIIPLPISGSHAAAISRLTRNASEPQHNDPFDKLLIAQAKAEGMILLTHDHLLSGYNELCVKTV